MFKVTEPAVKQIRKALQETQDSSLALRVAAKFTSERNIEYVMGFDQVTEGDDTVKFDDVIIIINNDSHELLDDATLDYVELEPDDFQFIFMNPLDPSYVPPKQ